MSPRRTLALAVLCLLVSLSAPLVVPLALLFTRRDAKALPRAFAWYDTPDEPELIGLYEPTVAWVQDRLGWYAAVWYWFGVRNRAHGFDSLFSREAPEHWPPQGSHERTGGAFIKRCQIGPLLCVFGWPVYASARYESKLEYRPQLAVKFRPGSANADK